MANYNLSLEKTVQRLIPPFLRKPRQTQWLLALTFPLRFLNDTFLRYVNDTRIVATLTSQTLLFEAYLNATYNAFFTSINDKIEIVHDEDLAISTYFSFETGVLEVFTYYEYESDSAPDVYFSSEKAGDIPKSFRVLLPATFEGNDELIRQIVGTVESYRVSPFDYDIVYV
ncbi:MAG: hypothetical protein AAF620_00220 [Bacteroidota bacterium]